MDKPIRHEKWMHEVLIVVLKIHLKNYSHKLKLFNYLKFHYIYRIFYNFNYSISYDDDDKLSYEENATI